MNANERAFYFLTTAAERRKTPNSAALLPFKFLTAPVADDKTERELFQREAQATANLLHPNITTIFDEEKEEEEKQDQGSPVPIVPSTFAGRPVEVQSTVCVKSEKVTLHV